MATRTKGASKKTGTAGKVAAAKKPAAKATAARKAAPKAAAAKPAARRPAGAAAVTKYEQPGAPWWKRIPLPTPK